MPCAERLCPAKRNVPCPAGLVVPVCGEVSATRSVNAPVRDAVMRSAMTPSTAVEKSSRSNVDPPTLKRVSAMDVPLPYAAEIELMALPNAQKVVDAVKEVL